MGKHLYREKLKSAWQRFMDSSEIEGSVVRKEIALSWKRCRAQGVDPHLQNRISSKISAGRTRQSPRNKTDHDCFIQASHPFLENLFHQIRSTEVLIYLMDNKGFILKAMGEGHLWDSIRRSGSYPYNILSEKNIGTTAVGIVLHSGEPAQVIAEEHYCEPFHNLNSFAAPIYDENRQLLWILGLGETYEIEEPRTFGMVLAAAKAIENQLKLLIESKRLTISNEYLKAVIDQTSRGLMLFDNEGKLAHQNPCAQSMLNLNEKNLGRSFSEVLPNPSLTGLLTSDQNHLFKEVVFEREGKQSRHLVSIQKIFNNQGDCVGKLMTLEEMKEIKKLVNRMIGATAQYNFSDILGNSQAIKEVINQGLMASRSASNVLISGESGTGKEMVAQSIHNASRRRSGPFLALNCAALPVDLIESELFGYEGGTFTGASKKGRPGKFELADEGTLFLDEMDKMPLEMQAKLLRVLEDRRVVRLGGSQYIPVDVRIMAASNAPLKKLIQTGTFREDFYYRLNVLQISIPPLRERKEDIPLLVDFFIREKCQRIGKMVSGFEEDAIHFLLSLDWPGNVRELENIVERAIHMAKSSIITARDVGRPEYKGKTFNSQDHLEKTSIDQAIKRPVKTLAEAEKEAIFYAIQQAGGNLTRACSFLNVSRPGIYRKIKKYGIVINRNVTKINDC